MAKLTRKELAEFITNERGDKVSVSQVMLNEKAWGLKESRGKDLNKRVIRYDKDKAIKALKKNGII